MIIESTLRVGVMGWVAGRGSVRHLAREVRVAWQRPNLITIQSLTNEVMGRRACSAKIRNYRSRRVPIESDNRVWFAYEVWRCLRSIWAVGERVKFRWQTE